MKKMHSIDTLSKSFYRQMLRIRLVEEALAARYADQEMRCPMHLCIGQEAIAVGVSQAMQSSDLVYSNHRAHGHYLAKGGDLNAMVAEIYGLATGCCGGRGGSMHLIDLSAGFMGATPIVGGTIPLAVGSAWAASISKKNYVVVVYFGDGCFEEGVIHESLNFSALHKLPIVFVCENNNYSVYTKRSERQPNRPIFEIAKAHGLAGACAVNGNDVEQVYKFALSAIESARNGGGPQFLECHTYRWREHCGPNFDDFLGYRNSIEIDEGLKACPLAYYESTLSKKYECSHDFFKIVKLELTQEINRAFDFCSASAKPKFSDSLRYLYA